MADPGEIMRQVDKLFREGGETTGEDSGGESGQAIAAEKPKAVKEAKISAGRRETSQAHREDLKDVKHSCYRGWYERADRFREVYRKSVQWTNGLRAVRGSAGSWRQRYGDSRKLRAQGNPGTRYIDVVTASELQAAVGERV